MPSQLPDVPMPTWAVTSSDGAGAKVTAPNWLAALGLAYDALHLPLPVEGLAIEEGPHGGARVRDVDSGVVWTVHIGAASDEEIAPQVRETVLRGSDVGGVQEEPALDGEKQDPWVV